VEIGTLMFGEHATMDLVRLAIPRRVYTQSHIEYVVEVILDVWRRTRQYSRVRTGAPGTVPAPLHRPIETCGALTVASRGRSPTGAPEALANVGATPRCFAGIGTGQGLS